MANEPKDETSAAAGEQDAEQLFKIQRVYLKDVSFESPMTPQVFINSQWQPQVSLNLHTETSKLENDLFEAVLTVTVTVKLEEDTVYLIEVKQAGLFLIKGLPEQRMGHLLGSFCPTQLFPYAREEIASLVQKGGFPQLLLDPVNFDALYSQHLESQKQNAPSSDTSQ